MLDKQEIWLLYKEYGWYTRNMADKQGIWWINKEYVG